jgi:multiple sugar transport system ATP-binding protein
VATVEFDRVAKMYADGTRAVDDLTIAVADGEFLVLVGPSGSGKTTVLRMVAGLEAITEGELRVGGRRVNDVPSRDRDVAMVFQSDALSPQLDVFDNMAFGLRLRKVPTPEISNRVNAAARQLGLSDYLHRKPRQLSDGQRQRVAMGRAFVLEPSVSLMDEPLSNLDIQLRIQLRAEIARSSRQTGVTTIYVTYDQTEATTLGHRVAVLKRGQLQQVASPQTLYDDPANLFVAGFIGSPAMNVLKGVFVAEPEPTLVLGDQRLRVGPAVLRSRPRLRAYTGRAVAVGIRPEDLSAGAAGHQPDAIVGTTLKLAEALGPTRFLHCGVDIAAVDTDDSKVPAGDERAGAPAARLPTVVGRLDPRTSVRAGDPISLAVDVNRLYLFDLDTGLSIR